MRLLTHLALTHINPALFEISANPIRGPPNDMAVALCRFRFDLEREIVGDTNRACDF
jgi:hypothetical protein